MPPPHWCHFSVRLPRLKIHKLLKEASLGYEDEKYCYVILSKTAPPPYSRIVASPEHHSGHTKLTLCTPPGIIAKTTFTRSQGPIYKTVKKLEWGEKV
jgi:ribosomal protein RSM22 (predicted rRNA methylase)